MGNCWGSRKQLHVMIDLDNEYGTKARKDEAFCAYVVCSSIASYLLLNTDFTQLRLPIELPGNDAVGFDRYLKNVNGWLDQHKHKVRAVSEVV
jgi:hypothetical protein